MQRNPNSFFTINPHREQYTERSSNARVEGVDADAVKTRRQIEILEEQIRLKQQLRDDFIVEEPSNVCS